MEEKIIPFETASPDELKLVLAGCEDKGFSCANVRVFGQQILTKQFNFPGSSMEDLIAGLKLEASETLSVDAANVEIAYEITGRESQGVQGVYLAMPRHLLMEYLDCFRSHSLMPTSVTSLSIGALNDFLKDQPNVGDNFCLVNFFKPHAVSIVFFANARPAFFRELYDLSDSDFKGKITDTIRYSCRHSASKKVDQIFFIGDISAKGDLIKSLKELGNFSSNLPFSTAGNAGKVDFTNLNLLEKFVCKPVERAQLVFIFSVVSVISLLLALSLAWNFVHVYGKLHEAKSSMHINDYYRALDLQEEVGHLKS